MFMAARAAQSNVQTVPSKLSQDAAPGIKARSTSPLDLSTCASFDKSHVTITINTPEVARHLKNAIREIDYSTASVVLAARLFGPPRVSLNWRDRCQLMRTLQRMPGLTHLTFQGTVMGQVLSCQLVSQSLPPTLESLTIHAGLILDDMEGIQKLATVLHQLPNLRKLKCHNFLNHVRNHSIENTSTEMDYRLLNPMIRAVAKGCPQLHTLELSCLASFVEWNEPLLSSDAIHLLLENCRELKSLQLTHLNLSDTEVETLAEHPSLRLAQLVVNANENTNKGLTRLIFGTCRIGSTISHLECMSHVKLTEELYEYLLWYTSPTRHPNCPLRHFQATLPLRLDPLLLQRKLRLQKLGLVRNFYNPTRSDAMACATVLSRVADDPTCLYMLLQQRPTLVSTQSCRDCHLTAGESRLHILVRALSSMSSSYLSFGGGVDWATAPHEASAVSPPRRGRNAARSVRPATFKTRLCAAMILIFWVTAVC